MLAALDSPEYITLEKLAQSLGVTARTLRGDDPDLAVAIAAKGRNRRTAQAEEKFVEKRAHIEESARRLIERGARVTMRSLRKETGLSLGPSPRTTRLLDGVLTSAPRSST
jgi:hypothetical protein